MRDNGLTVLVDVELHAVEFQQQIVRKLDVGLVDFVDQQHRPLFGREGIPELAALDVVADVVDPFVTQLRITQAADGVIFVQTLLRLGRRFDVPFDQFGVERLCDLVGQDGLARAGLSFDQQRTFKSRGRIDRDHQVLGSDVVVESLQACCLPVRFASCHVNSGGQTRVGRPVRSGCGCRTAGAGRVGIRLAVA